MLSGVSKKLCRVPFDFVPFAFYLLSGIFNIIRKTVWQEGVIFWYDYKKGLKNNGFYFLIIGLFLSIIFFVFNYLLRQELIDHSTLNLISFCCSAIALLILVLFIPLLLHQTIIYNLKFLHKIKNTLIIFSKLFYIFIILAVTRFITSKSGKYFMKQQQAVGSLNGYIEEMINFIKELIDQGYAYEVDGDVYFRVKKFHSFLIKIMIPCFRI